MDEGPKVPDFFSYFLPQRSGTSHPMTRGLTGRSYSNLLLAWLQKSSQRLPTSSQALSGWGTPGASETDCHQSAFNALVWQWHTNLAPRPLAADGRGSPRPHGSPEPWVTKSNASHGDVVPAQSSPSPRPALQLRMETKMQRKMKEMLITVPHCLKKKKVMTLKLTSVLGVKTHAQKQGACTERVKL